MTFDIIELAKNVVCFKDLHELDAISLAFAILKNAGELRPDANNDPRLPWCEMKKMELDDQRIHLKDRWQWNAPANTFPLMEVKGDGGRGYTVDVEVCTTNGGLFRGYIDYKGHKEKYWVVQLPDGTDMQLPFSCVCGWRRLDEELPCKQEQKCAC